MNVMLCDEWGEGIQNRLKMRDVICECSLNIYYGHMHGHENLKGNKCSNISKCRGSSYREVAAPSGKTCFLVSPVLLQVVNNLLQIGNIL